MRFPPSEVDELHVGSRDGVRFWSRLPHWITHVCEALEARPQHQMCLFHLYCGDVLVNEARFVRSLPYLLVLGLFFFLHQLRQSWKHQLSHLFKESWKVTLCLLHIIKVCVLMLPDETVHLLTVKLRSWLTGQFVLEPPNEPKSSSPLLGLEDWRRTETSQRRDNTAEMERVGKKEGWVRCCELELSELWDRNKKRNRHICIRVVLQPRSWLWAQKTCCTYACLRRGHTWETPHARTHTHKPKT